MCVCARVCGSQTQSLVNNIINMCVSVCVWALNLIEPDTKKTQGEHKDTHIASGFAETSSPGSHPEPLGERAYYLIWVCLMCNLWIFYVYVMAELLLKRVEVTCHLAWYFYLGSTNCFDMRTHTHTRTHVHTHGHTDNVNFDSSCGKRFNDASEIFCIPLCALCD